LGHGDQACKREDSDNVPGSTHPGLILMARTVALGFDSLCTWGLGRDSTDDRTTAKEWLQRFSPKNRRRYRMKEKVAPFDEQNPSKRPRKSEHNRYHNLVPRFYEPPALERRPVIVRIPR
jgi:hypothetical protein